MSILVDGKPVGLCSDHAGFELKSVIEGYFEANGIAYRDFGTDSDASCDYPDFAHPCALAVEAGEVYPAVAMCGSGNGIAMTLNKHQHIRAALVWVPEIAKMTRMHNDANVLVMPGRYISCDTAREIMNQFLNTPFEGGRHVRRIEKIPVQPTANS